MAGGGKGGSNKGSETVNTAPWGGQQPYLSYLYQQAQGLPEQQAYPFPGFVPFSPASAQAMQSQQTRATEGSPLLQAAQDQTMATTQGDYLHGGAGFNRAFEAASRSITPQVQGQFERAGRFGGGLAQGAHTQALGDAFAGLYDQERGRQMTAAAMAPSMAQQDYADIGRLAQVGTQQEAKAGEALSDAMSRWNFQQQAPYTRLAAQIPAISGALPGSSVEQPLPQTSPLSGALGGALGGTAMFGFPWGTIGGGALGYMGSK